MQTRTFRRFAARLAVAALALAALATPAAAIKLENYEKYKLDTRNMRATVKSLLEVRLEGVMLGLLIANRGIAAAGGKPLFCAPENAQMGGPEVMKLLDQELNSGRTADGKPYPSDANVESVVLTVARKRWPCPR